MFKDVLRHADLSMYAEVGLVIFTLVFVAILIQTLVARKADVKRWSELPLEDGTASNNERSVHN